MNIFVKMKCFLTLPFLMVTLSGCGAEEYVQTFQEVAVIEKQQDNILTMDELELAAEEQNWKEDINSRISFELEGHDTYAYDTLNYAEKIWYEEINMLLSTRYDEVIQLSQEALEAGLNEESLEKIFRCVLIDHPEYFYVDGHEYIRYTLRDELVALELKANYTADVQECIARKRQIEAEADKLLAMAPMDGSDYEKIKYVYETLIYNTEYDLEAPDNQNIYSVFVGKASVCQGYAQATQYLLNRLGVECTLVYGLVDEEAHAWNMVKSGDAYYYVDTTWGDASYTLQGEQEAVETVPDINYDYLCVTSEQLFCTHVLEHEVELPVCESLEDNYYVREGSYFYSYDTEQLQREFDEAFAEGKNAVTIKCASEEVYNEMYTELVENQQIFDYLDSEQKKISYSDDGQQLSMTFWMTK